jgi:hypothetical protein
MNHISQKRAAAERVESYCELHPGSPSAVRLPRVFARSGSWIALLGHTVREGIVGVGPSVESALHDFDIQYLNFLRQPHEAAFDKAA